MGNPNAPQILPASNMLATRLKNGAYRRVPDEALLAEAEAAIKALADSYPAILAEAAGEMARIISAGGAGGASLDLATLYRHAHDVKGHAASVGYPMATEVAQSLCRVIDLRPALGGEARGFVVLRAHVDALMAIARNRCSGDGGETGRKIITALSRLVAALPAAAKP